MSYQEAQQGILVELKKVRAELAEHEATFKLRWDADMRAIKRWRAEHPEARALTWPDHADLVIWLLTQLEAPEHPVGRLTTALQEILSAEEVRCIACLGEGSEVPATWRETVSWVLCDDCAESARNNGRKLEAVVQTDAARIARLALEGT